MAIILFDGEERIDLLPLTYTRPIAEIRIGILTIKEKWAHYFKDDIGYLTEDYLQKKYPYIAGDVQLFVRGNVCPNSILVDAILSLEENKGISQGGKLIAFKGTKTQFEEAGEIDNIFVGDLLFVNYPWDIFSNNGDAIQYDFDRLTDGRTSQFLSDTNTVLGPENVFVEEGAKVECAIINATKGPVYIGKDAEIMEGSIVRGPLALCDHATLKLGTKIYGPTTVGPHSKVGGEVNNSVILGYSNKGHDGFIGNSVIGEWCNIGADSNNSNLKNNYAEVRLWSYRAERYIPTGLQFCGLIMGDHSKCGINTMFNTGTVVGVNANIYGAGFPRNFVPSFAWGSAAGMKEYKTNKAYEVAEVVMKRRGLSFNDVEKEILDEIFERSSKHRRF